MVYIMTKISCFEFADGSYSQIDCDLPAFDNEVQYILLIICILKQFILSKLFSIMTCIYNRVALDIY